MKKSLLIIGLILAIVSVSAVSAGLFGEDQNEGILKIESEDGSMSGTLKITEFKNIEANDDGTYNATQFYKDGISLKGNSHDIRIKDGKAEYTLHNDTEFFTVEYFISDIRPDYGFDNDTAPIVTVEYLFNGDSLLSSSEEAYADQCDVSFGEDIYKVDGEQIDLNIDDSDLDWLNG